MVRAARPNPSYDGECVSQCVPQTCFSDRLVKIYASGLRRWSDAAKAEAVLDALEVGATQVLGLDTFLRKMGADYAQHHLELMFCDNGKGRAARVKLLACHISL